MSRILIEVDSQVADAFLKVSSDKRIRITNTINNYLKKVFLSNNQADYKKLMDQLSEEARSNGLTEELLKDILESND